MEPNKLATSMNVLAMNVLVYCTEVNHFITSVNCFHPALKYTREIYETSVAFLDIKVSINGNGLSTSVCYKPTDSHSYIFLTFMFSSFKDSIAFSQSLWRRRLCSYDSDVSNKSKEMCQFVKKRGYPDSYNLFTFIYLYSVVNTAQHRAQQIAWQSALQMSQKKKIHTTSQSKTSV